MKTNKLGMVATVMVPAMLSLSLAQAAQPVQWNDLPKKIGRGKMRSDDREDRQYRVVTKDGRLHAGYALTFSPIDVTVYQGQSSHANRSRKSRFTAMGD